MAAAGPGKYFSWAIISTQLYEIKIQTTTKGKTMKVKDFIKQLSKFDQNLDVVFYNDRLDENHWGCELSVDNCNGKDLMIYPTIEVA